MCVYLEQDYTNTWKGHIPLLPNRVFLRAGEGEPNIASILARFGLSFQVSIGHCRVYPSLHCNNKLMGELLQRKVFTILICFALIKQPPVRKCFGPRRYDDSGMIFKIQTVKCN